MHPDDDFRPSAARLIDSLRDTGYSPEAAFADVIDNAIAAGASKIAIELSILYGDVRVTFLDNGIGMSESELRFAMRYGSPKRDNPKSLGKFGMGLKTASTAFCERLVVMSTKDKSTSIRAWDLQTIRDKDVWQLETPDWQDYYEDQLELNKLAGITPTESATMIIWEKIDRLVPLNNERQLSNSLKVLGEELCEELSAVFARFLDHANIDYPNVTISMKVDNEPEFELTPWDPLSLSLNIENQRPRTLKLPEKKLTAILPNNQATEFSIRGSILPSQNELTAEEQKLVRYSLDNQGFYIYREGRLIWHEGWPPRMYKKEGKMTRLRVVLDFTHELDDLFKIDFRKSRIIIPPMVRDALKEIVAPWRNHVLNTISNQEINNPENDSDAATTRHQRAINAINKHKDQTKVAEVKVDGGTATIRNKFNMKPVEIDGVHIYEDSKIRVREENSLDGRLLWAAALDHEGEVCVQLGRSHPYFERLYATCKSNPDAMMALDMLLWALANAEFGSWSESNKTVISNFRQQVSSSLSFLCQELPDPSDD